MKEDRIILSEKYGVNASINMCLLCGKDIGIVMFGKLEGDREAPKKCYTGEVCDGCISKLAADNEVVIVDGEKGRYVTVSADALTSQGRGLAGENRTLFVTSETFDSRIKYEDD